MIFIEPGQTSEHYFVISVIEIISLYTLWANKTPALTSRVEVALETGRGQVVGPDDKLSGLQLLSLEIVNQMKKVVKTLIRHCYWLVDRVSFHCL